MLAKKPLADIDDVTKEKGNFMVTSTTNSVDFLPSDQVNLHKKLTIKTITASSWMSDATVAGVVDLRDHNGWMPDPASKGDVHLTIAFEKSIDPKQTPYFNNQLYFAKGKYHIAADYEIFAYKGNDDGSVFTKDQIEVIKLAATGKPLSSVQTVTLNSIYQEFSQDKQALRYQLVNLKDRFKELTEKHSTMVMNVSAKPRKTFILNRGDYAQPTVEVDAGTLSALPMYAEAKAKQDRMDLANWLVMEKNPLPARVYVNRLWQLCFGTGIVKTAADFGLQGEWPSHPALLDWLAVDFIEQGWNIKMIVKKIVTSATYRQDSNPTPKTLDRDPQNRLLARGPRHRFQAELIRDIALQTSGLLVNRIGGASVNPYSPGDLWREVSHYGSTPATAQTFHQDHGEKLYRRSIYTYWKRTMPPPNMAAFDAPSREVCTITRSATNTPLQALILLNDVQFVETNRNLASLMIQHQGDIHAKIQTAVMRVLARPAKENEFQVLSKTYARELAHFQANPEQAAQLLTSGESPLPDSYSKAELAAWSQVATVLLNLSETITQH
jgi:hypothetical protein